MKSSAVESAGRSAEDDRGDLCGSERCVTSVIEIDTSPEVLTSCVGDSESGTTTGTFESMLILAALRSLWRLAKPLTEPVNQTQYIGTRE